MENLELILKQIGSIIWGPPTWVLMLLGGAYLSVRTNWLQVTKFGVYINQTLFSIFRKKKAGGEGDISPFQALNTAMSATMGVGTLAGTATAIAFGGPGAVFWMWVVAFFGITTKFSEITLAVHFRHKNEKGEVLGGPMIYIEKGLGWKWLAKIFAVAGAAAAFGIGNMVQANTGADALQYAFGIPRLLTGIVAAVLIGLVIIGGIKRIGTTAEKIIPVLAMFCIISCIAILITNISLVPEAFGRIFAGAFTNQGAVGGFAGATIMYAVRYGLMRGVFSNEAGLGSAPIAHAAAKTDHPVKQGFWGAFEVFLDTHVMCTLVALVILTSGAWTEINSTTGTAYTGAPLIMAAFRMSFLGPVVGNALMAFLIATFGFTTILGWAFYGEKCMEYLTGTTKSNLFYRILFLPVIIGGALGGLKIIWTIADILNALMAIPNMIGVVALGGVVAKITKDYFSKKPYISFEDAKK
jgi:AGCS family alanine or glycine:cation symporter